MTRMETEPDGRVRRDSGDKRDRWAAVRYRCSPSNAQTASTAMKQWVLRHDRFIGETVQDESGMRARLPHERSGLVRLGWLALGPIPGGVLLDNRDDLGDARSRAVVFPIWRRREWTSGTDTAPDR